MSMVARVGRPFALHRSRVRHRVCDITDFRDKKRGQWDGNTWRHKFMVTEFVKERRQSV
jgi:hypothetical protein